jgi:anti-sigma factor (TIGR02949 family)
MNETHLTVERLVDYLHGELSPQEDAAVHAHLAECRECSEARDAETSLSELLRAHARTEERELPAGVVARIWDAIDNARAPSPWQRLLAAMRPAIALPAAAALALALYFARTLPHGMLGTPKIDAAYYVENHAALTATTPFAEDSPLPVVLTSDEVR